MTNPVPPDPVESFARVEPPSGHARRVLARTGPGAPQAAEPGRRRPPLRWVLPVAATVLGAFGAYVQSDRSSRDVPLAPPPPGETWSGKGVDEPVLPPRAYWEMSAVEEFERLRPETRRAHVTQTALAPGMARAPYTDVRAAVDWTSRDAPAPIAAEPIAIEAVGIMPLAETPDVVPAPIAITPIPLAPHAQEAP